MQKVYINPVEDHLCRKLNEAFPGRLFSIEREFTKDDFKQIIIYHDAYLPDDELLQLGAFMDKYCHGVLQYRLVRMVF